jgi:hypothetical protein
MRPLLKHKSRRRRGAIVILTAILLVLMLGVIAFAVDMGYLLLTRTQLQAAADSAAIAAAWYPPQSSENMILTAQQFAGYHIAAAKPVILDAADVELGTWDFANRNFTASGSPYNAVRVTARRDNTTGGQVSLFFARVIGSDACAVRAQAVAAFVDNFSGFRDPGSAGNVPILPIAMSKAACDGLLAGSGPDSWTWDSQSKHVVPGSDGIREGILYPGTTGAAGNLGTVNIGIGNGTSGLSQQILNGVSSQDLAPYGGKLDLGPGGTLELQGNPGLSAALQEPLAALRGQTRIVPVYSQVTGTGANAQYTIVKFLGIRIMDVDLTGSDKRLIVQPANIVVRNGIRSSNGVRTSQSVFSPVALVQ